MSVVKVMLVVFACTVLSSCMSSPGSSLATDASAKEYRLGFGDRLDLLIYQAEGLSRNYQVNSKGEIQIPLVGAMAVGGLTVDEAQTYIKETLAATYMIDPQVTLSISEYGAAGVVFIDGAVKQPGSYDIQRDTTILGLIALAGGTEWSSSRRKVRVVRKEGGALRIKVINLARIRANKDPDFKLLPGDLVVLGHHPIKRGLAGFFTYGLRLAIFL